MLPVTVNVVPSNVKLPLSSIAPEVPANTTRPAVKSLTIALPAVKSVPSQSSVALSSSAPLVPAVTILPLVKSLTAAVANTTSPVPFGVTVIAPLAPSVITIVPELVPLFVSSVKSCAPLEVIVAPPAPVPTTTSPVPLGAMFTLPFVSVALSVLPFKSKLSTVISPVTFKPPVISKSLPSHVRLASSSNAPLVPATTILLSVKPLTIALLTVKSVPS